MTMQRNRPVSAKAEAAFAKVREICLALPGVAATRSHSSDSFSVGKRAFAYCLDNHHGDGRLAIWCKGDFEAQMTLIEQDPERFFVPPYLGPRGWVGARLDRGVDWSMIAALLADAYRMIAPKRLAMGIAAADSTKERPKPKSPARRSTRDAEAIRAKKPSASQRARRRS